MSNGHASTTFFHRSTILRRGCNRILSLHDSVGNWTFNTKTIYDIILKYYQELFNTQLTSCQNEYIPTLSNSPTNDDIQTFNRTLSIIEITKAVYSFKPLKAQAQMDYTPFSSKTFGRKLSKRLSTLVNTPSIHLLFHQK